MSASSFADLLELLRAQTLGVPPDGGGGQENEHRGDRRAEEQLIRVEIAPRVARVFGEDLRRRLERDGADDDRIENACEHHGQNDVDDHLDALHRTGAALGRIVARRGREETGHHKIARHDERPADAEKRHGVSDKLDEIGDNTAEHLHERDGVIEFFLAEPVHDFSGGDGQHRRGEHDDGDGDDVVFDPERDLHERDHVRLPHLHGETRKHHAEKADVDHFVRADILRPEREDDLAQIALALRRAKVRTVLKEPEPQNTGNGCDCTEHEIKSRPVAVHGHGVKPREDHNEREDRHDAQIDIDGAAVGDVRHVRDPGGKRRVVRRRADGGHDAVHDDERRHRKTHRQRDLPVAEKRERGGRRAPEDVPPADERAAASHTVGPRGAEERGERRGNGACGDRSARRPASGGDVFLDVCGEIDVLHHPRDLADKAEDQKAGPYSAAERCAFAPGADGVIHAVSLSFAK